MNATNLTEDVKLTCTLTGTSPDYGTVYVDEDMNLIHTPEEADANETLHVENGILSVKTEENEYRLNGNDLGVIRHRLNGSVTAEAWVYTAVPEKLVEFKYDSNGLRSQKKVTGHGQTIVTNYIYHGKQLSDLTCGTDTLHFFYDAQDRSAKVDCNGTLYTYVHSLQGDVADLLGGTGVLVVEYVYEAWGKPLSIKGVLPATLGQRNPFRYRRYIYDQEAEIYYLRSRYYNMMGERFVSADIIDNVYVYTNSLYCYCVNSLLRYIAPAGCLIAFRFSLDAGVPYPAVSLFPTFPGEVVFLTMPLPEYLDDIHQTSPYIRQARISANNQPESLDKENSRLNRSEYPPARRYRFSTRKEAYERAKRAGNEREPILHYQNDAPHYHPNVPTDHTHLAHQPTFHDHYYFPVRGVIMFEYIGREYNPYKNPYI